MHCVWVTIVRFFARRNVFVHFMERKKCFHTRSTEKWLCIYPNISSVSLFLSSACCICSIVKWIEMKEDLLHERLCDVTQQISLTWKCVISNCRYSQHSKNCFDNSFDSVIETLGFVYSFNVINTSYLLFRIEQNFLFKFIFQLWASTVILNG